MLDASPTSVASDRDSGAPRRTGPARQAGSRRGGRDASTVVHETFAGYAQRGIFRSFGAQEASGGHTHFSFRWHTDVPLTVVYHAGTHALTFRNLLPGIDRRSEMYRHLTAFVRGRTSRVLPSHRRIDPRKAAVRLTTRAGMTSLVVSLRPAHLEYGVRKAINLVHELFVSVLRDPLYFAYMVEHFGLDPDM